MDEQEVYCGDCKFFSVSEDGPTGQIGHCMRYPPVPDQNQVPRWPEFFGDNWCGEFQPRQKSVEPTPTADQ